MTFLVMGLFLGVNTKSTGHALHVDLILLFDGQKNWRRLYLKEIVSGCEGPIHIRCTPMLNTLMERRRCKQGHIQQQPLNNCDGLEGQRNGW
jgi:hypothetical protein